MRTNRRDPRRRGVRPHEPEIIERVWWFERYNDGSAYFDIMPPVDPERVELRSAHLFASCRGWVRFLGRHEAYLPRALPTWRVEPS